MSDTTTIADLQADAADAMEAAHNALAALRRAYKAAGMDWSFNRMSDALACLDDADNWVERASEGEDE